MRPQTPFGNQPLSEAIQSRVAAVKADPLSADARYELSLLLSFAGDLDRASTHLDALAVAHPEMLMGSRIHRSLLEAEATRLAVFAGNGDPLLPPDCPRSVEFRRAALRERANGSDDLAIARMRLALDQAVELESKSEPAPFSVNGRPERVLVRDYDDFLDPVLEIYAGGNYLWLPFQDIAWLEMKAPETLADLLWIQATLIDIHGVEALVHIPSRYHDTRLSEDDSLLSAGKTEWRDVHGLGFTGLGQRILAMTPESGGEGTLGEIGILDVRTLERL